MKGKSVTFRPKGDFRQRIEKLCKATERPITWILEKCIEGHLPALERKYAEELLKLSDSEDVQGAEGALGERPLPKQREPGTYSSFHSPYPKHQDNRNETKDEPATGGKSAKKKKAA